MAIIKPADFLQSRFFQSLTQHFGLIFKQLLIISMGILGYFLLIGLHLFLHEASFSWFSKPMGLLSILLFFLFFAELALIIANISAAAFWICAKKLQGKGSYAETSLKLLWTTLYSILPFGLFVVLLQFDKKLGIVIHNLSCIGLLASLIYGFMALSKGFSKLHRISLYRTYAAFLLGIIVQAPFVFSILYFAVSYGRTLFVVLMPLTIQVIVTLSVIFFGLKAFEILRKRSRA